MSNAYKCSFCGRGYQRKIYFSRHAAMCELMCKSIKERQLENQECDEIPSLRTLYDVILEMATKMSVMEQKMNEMSKWVDLKKRKINIIDWLNQTHKGDIETLTVEELIARIKVERRHLEYLFEEDYLGTILFVLKELLPLDQGKDDSNTIKAFDVKPNTLFVNTGGTPVSPHNTVDRGADGGDNTSCVGADGGDNTSCVGADGGHPRGSNTSYMGVDGGPPRRIANELGGEASLSPTASGIARWIIMPDTLFQQLVNVIMKQLLDEFIIWQKANASKMDQDDFAIKYSINARKIMGDNLTREQIYGKVKLDLYKYLKRAIPLAVGYV